MDLQKYQVETWVSYLSFQANAIRHSHMDPVPVAQSWISANSGIKFNLQFKFVYFFKTSEKKTPINLDKISEGIFPNL
jgi:hypothetical protein